MNLLQRWEKQHFEKIIDELNKAGIELKVENIPLVIKETSFKIRSKKYSNECPYYLKGISCHPEINDLNCFLCACPQYLSKSLGGGCKTKSRFGKVNYNKNLPLGRVWDCSDCSAYHYPKSVEKFLKSNLQNILNIACKKI